MECPVEYYEGPDEKGKNRYICPRCERLTGWTIAPPEKYHRLCRVPGVGDQIAKWLAFIGIKKKPGCGCNKRQDYLNKLGQKLKQNKGG